MNYPNQDSKQLSNDQEYPQSNDSQGKVAPIDLDKTTRRLGYLLIACGICGLSIAAVLGYLFTLFFCLARSREPMSALDIAFHTILFDFFIAIPLGTPIGIATIVQVRKYKKNFGKFPHIGKLIFGLIGVILCLTPVVLTVLIIYLVRIINLIAYK